jgi:hypothetical protein
VPDGRGVTGEVSGWERSEIVEDEDDLKPSDANASPTGWLVV